MPRRQHHDRYRGRSPDETGEIEAGLAGHHDIQDQEVEVQAQKLGTGIAGAGGGRDAIALAGKEAREQVADAAGVVGQQGAGGIRGGGGRGGGGGGGGGARPRPFAFLGGEREWG